jgi:hypothetical protein
MNTYLKQLKDYLRELPEGEERDRTLRAITKEEEQ